MNLHITPSFIIDRLCKTASVVLFLVKIQVLANCKHSLNGKVKDTVYLDTY